MTLEQLDEFVFKITNEASELIDGAGTTKGVESVTRSVLQCMYLEALKDVLNIAKIDIHNGIDDKHDWVFVRTIEKRIKLLETNISKTP